MERPNNKERFKKAVENGKFTMDEELYFIKLLVSKYNFISKSQYARKNNITPQGVDARLKSGNDPYITLAGKLMIIE